MLRSSMVIDALAIPTWTRANFGDMQVGGLTAVNLICSIWQNFEASMRRLARLREAIADNADLVMLVRSVEDIDRADETGRTGIIIGWQNSSGFDGHLAYVPLLADIGLRVVQITFNTANAAGSGCYESHDGGLTDHGRDLVGALNAHGIAIDLTHVGDRTARDVIERSARPVLYTHSSPRALREHFRNKSDEDMRRVADRGGVVAVATLPHYLPSGLDSTVDDMAAAIAYVAKTSGEDCAAIGTDLTPGQPSSFLDYVSRDQGFGRKLIDYSTPPVLPGISSFRHYPNVAEALRRQGLAPSTIDKIMGLNLRRFFGDVWSTHAPSSASPSDAASAA